MAEKKSGSKKRVLTAEQKRSYGMYRNRFISDNYKTYIIRLNYTKDKDIIDELDNLKERYGSLTEGIRKIIEFYEVNQEGTLPESNSNQGKSEDQQDSSN